jgi:hypothetical protein
MGADSELDGKDQILVDMRWLSLAEITERDRAYLWAAGLLSHPEFQEEVSSRANALTYPGE